MHKVHIIYVERFIMIISFTFMFIRRGEIVGERESVCVCGKKRS